MKSFVLFYHWSYNFKFNVVPGTNRLKFVNQGKEIIELEPELNTFFTFEKTK